MPGSMWNSVCAAASCAVYSCANPTAKAPNASNPPPPTGSVETASCHAKLRR
jgi:hypothetical protein